MNQTTKQNNNNNDSNSNKKWICLGVISGRNTLAALHPPAHTTELTRPSGSRRTHLAGFSPLLVSPREESSRRRPYFHVKSIKSLRSRAQGAHTRSGQARPPAPALVPAPLLWGSMVSCSWGPTGRAPRAAAAAAAAATAPPKASPPGPASLRLP